MTRELVDRMRTCAAALTAGSGYTAMAIMDAAGLLTEAADLLEPRQAPEPPGELMEVLPALPPQSPGPIGKPVWGGYEALRATPTSIATQPCPACGSIDARIVTRVNLTGRRGLRLTCPACQHQWEYGA